jgi:hypothetical protein
MTHEQTLLRHIVRHFKEHAPYLQQDAEYKEAADGLEAEHERHQRAGERHEDPREEKKTR